MCKVWAISRGRRAAGYWNNIQGLEVRLSAQKLPARLAGTLCDYLASKFFAAAKRAPWAENMRSCYYLTFYPPSQKTMGLPMDECTKSYGGISPQTMGG